MTDALAERKDNENAVHSGDEDVRQYIQEIRCYPLLTPEQELELAKGCAAGEPEAVRLMVSSNLRLVVAIAREYAGRGVPLLDLIQEGSIGLIGAARGFDYTEGVRFSAYAAKSIRNRIAKTLSSDTGVIRVTAYGADRMRRLTRVRRQFLVEFGREPEPSELSAETGIPESKVTELLRQFPEVCSLDAALGDDGDTPMGVLLPGDEELEPQAVLIRQEMNGLLDALLSRLDERQRRILRLRYGMEDGVCHSREEIAGEVGLSRERVRQIEQQAIKRLNKLGAELGLENFLE